MRFLDILKRAGGVAVAALAVACGGGTTAAPVVGGDPGGGGLSGVSQENQVVIQFDRNGDTQPDTLTLDATESPFEIVSALDGTEGGGAIDVSDALRGQPIDPALSEALANHLATSFDVASQTQIDVVLANGETVTVTVFE